MAEQRGVFDGEVRARLALARVLMLQGGEASYAEALALLDVGQSRAEQNSLQSGKAGGVEHRSDRRLSGGRGARPHVRVKPCPAS